MRQEDEVVIPILTIGFYNFDFLDFKSKNWEVVIPILTIGFYNQIHTQLLKEVILKVVIPILTIGFYNKMLMPLNTTLLKLSYPS